MRKIDDRPVGSKPAEVPVPLPQETRPSIPGGNPPISEDPTMPVMVQDNPLIGSAVDPEELAAAALAARPKRYRVINGGQVMCGGYRTPMRAGKIVDSSNYNIVSLRTQGIQLRELEDGEL